MSENNSGETGGTDEGKPPAGGAPANANGGAGDNGQGSEHWKSAARTWETRAKADGARAETLAAELEKLKAAQMTDTEKAIAQAKAEAAKAAQDEMAGKYGRRLVLSEARAALAGRDVADPDALLEAFDHSGFLKDGEPDAAAIKTWAERIAPARQRIPDLGQGRGRGAAAQPTSINDLIRRGAGRTV